jgi:hypothetical protein
MKERRNVIKQEHDTDHSISVKGGDFINSLSDY